MPMPNVLSCNVQECVYNEGMECHATSITVGESHPSCDTFTVDQSGAMTQGEIAEVSQCMVDQCKYNRNMSCNAQGVTVGHHADHADCNTFELT